MIKDYELLESELYKLKNQILSMLDCFVGVTANDLRNQIHKCDDAETLVNLSINALSYITGRCGIEKDKNEGGSVSIHFDNNNNIIDDSPQAHYLITEDHKEQKDVAQQRGVESQSR